MRTSGRTVLITASIGVHLAVGFAFFVSSIWKIERLEAGNRPFDLKVAGEPPPEAGSPEGSPAPAFKPKKKKEQQEKKIVEETVQPTETKKPDASDAAKAAFTGANATTDGNGLGSGHDKGSGNGRGSSAIGDGSGDGSGSGSGSAEDPCKKAEIVPPTVLRGLRTSGETQIRPSEVTKTEIIRSGKTQVVAMFRACVGTDGRLFELKLLKSSGFGDYDATLTSGLRAWTYKPYMIDRCGLGPRPVPVCATVTFIYGMH